MKAKGVMGSAERGELTWQQTWISELLRRDGEDIDQLGTRPVLFALPGDVTDDVLRRRFRELVAREAALQITCIQDRPGGYVMYTPAAEPPLRRESAGSSEELRRLCLDFAGPLFDRASGEPLWRALIVEHPDVRGNPARSLCAVFDYHISDGTSLHNFRDAVVTGSSATTGPENGPYREWVGWQRREYPPNAAEVVTKASEFWRHYLDGVVPDQPTVFPFAVAPDGPLSGRVCSLNTRLAVTVPMLRSAGSRLKSSPFLVVLAGLASSIGRVAGVTDTVLRTNSNGRPNGYAGTFGAFADILPVRVRHESLSDPHQALRAARNGWMGVLPHLTTPFEYTMQLCGEPDAAKRRLGYPQVLFNFMPLPVGVQALEPGTTEYPGQLGTFQFMIMTAETGGVYLKCEFDPERFAADEVRAFIGQLEDALGELTGLTEPTGLTV